MAASERLKSGKSHRPPLQEVGHQRRKGRKTVFMPHLNTTAGRAVKGRGAVDGARFFGWEGAAGTALDARAARLESAGVAVAAEPQTLADARRVRALISFHDPAGNRLEAFHGAEVDDTPFSPGRSISGFRTGPLGLGHVVLTVANIEPVMKFYVDVLGFGLSDYIEKPFRAYFFHVNP